MTTYDDAQKRNEQAKREALAALAQGGSQGLAAHQQAQAQAQASRQAGIDNVLRSAAQRGAPPEMQAMSQQIVGSVGDRYAAANQQAQSSRAAALDMLNRGNANYFDQVGAAVPIHKGITDRKVAAIQAERAEQEAERALRREEMALRKQQIDAELRKLAQGEAMDPADVLRMLGGQEMAGVAIKGAAGMARQRAAQQEAANTPLGGRGGGLFDFDMAGRIKAAESQPWEEVVGQEMGLAPGQASALTKPEPKKPLKDAEVQSKPYYRAIERKLVALIDSGQASRQQIIDAINKDYGKQFPRSVALLLKQYGPDLRRISRDDD